MSPIPMLAFHDWLVELRRDFHKIPERGYREEKTAAKIRQVLDQLNVNYRSAVDRATDPRSSR